MWNARRVQLGGKKSFWVLFFHDSYEVVSSIIMLPKIIPRPFQRIYVFFLSVKNSGFGDRNTEGSDFCVSRSKGRDLQNSLEVSLSNFFFKHTL